MTNHTGRISGLGLSQDGTILASRSDSTIRLWHAISQAEAEKIKGAKKE